jgi:hypothetical protein
MIEPPAIAIPRRLTQPAASAARAVALRIGAMRIRDLAGHMPHCDGHTGLPVAVRLRYGPRGGFRAVELDLGGGRPKVWVDPWPAPIGGSTFFVGA